MSTTIHHPSAVRAMQTMGTYITAARKERLWSVEELADRVGVSAKTLSKVERGDPSVSVATYFDAAAFLGIPLFSADEREIEIERARIENRLSLLPNRIHKPRRVRNAF